MTAEQTIETITPDVLLHRVRDLHDRGYRFVQIGATRLPEAVEVLYSLDLDGQLTNLRLCLPPSQPRIPSISSVYGCVLLYENEMHDLFNIKVDGMTVDFKGNLYRTAVKFPFGSVKAPGAKMTPAAATGNKATPPTTALAE